MRRSQEITSGFYSQTVLDGTGEARIGEKGFDKTCTGTYVLKSFKETQV